MQILADYHTHTVYSHGKGTIEDNVKEAISKGIKTIGISDHSYKHMTYGVKIKDIYKMREEVNKLNLKYSNIDILLGMECNILDENGNIDINDEVSKLLDYVMAGYHFGSSPTSLKSMLNHCNNYVLKNEKSKEYNTKAIINAMKNNDIFIITHPGDKGDVYIEEIAKVAKDTDTRLEINSSHSYLNASQLNQIKHIGNKFIIGSDAHRPENVGNFELAMKNIREANLDLSLVENIKL
ncbi:PHP domain-containing protein [Romboutsia lituseburensis]|uniref:Putative hydrolase n=1 Tax=Romboutsia lituseburensis DSM 797 TaxID=1121325 RepID=A0A1G9RJD7_9FIRM|nr:PHP domain-containing protein [Romboutsia lituseburensis]CEH32734.1 PHP domain protein [Romboutsia lituseburensis]SDM23439.1 putative hydrolase [Romboutsia lituseburensis DSM 797]